jgi:hypothetical protein
MAKYWAKYSTNTFSNEEDSISAIPSFLSAKTLYAQGEDIDFDNIFAVGHQNIIECIIYKSDITNVSLQASNHRTGYTHKIVFEECKIKEVRLINLSFRSLSFINCNVENIDIRHSTSLHNLELNGNNEIKSLIINECVITQFAIKDAKLIENVKITDGKIINFQISNSKLTDFECFRIKTFSNPSIYKCVFNKISFQENDLHGSLYLDNCLGGKLEFKLCEFHLDNIYIPNCSMRLDFNKVRVYPKVIFNINQSQKSKIYFNRCYFSNEVLFLGQIANNEKNLYISDTVFRDLVLFDDDNAKSLVIKETLFQKGLMLPIPEIHRITEIDSSVWCILKNQTICRNENINAIEYRKNELTSYTHELKINGTHFQERLVLFFNKISNNHGINWGLGIFFTVFFWLLFYSIFVMSKDNFYGLFHRGSIFLLTDSHYWSDAISFLWIPQGLADLANGLKENHSGLNEVIMTISFFLGKIFIAYGVFQTISAFRRHGKA